MRLAGELGLWMEPDEKDKRIKAVSKEQLWPRSGKLHTTGGWSSLKGPGSTGIKGKSQLSIDNHSKLLFLTPDGYDLCPLWSLRDLSAICCDHLSENLSVKK